jgi:lipopolysaccharide biosynthesis protein
MLADPQSDMPFCLCWANENWTRKWDASEQQILIAQDYRPQDDLGFIQSVMPFLTDPRYLKIDGAPLLIVYRPQSLPDPRNTLRVWREYARSQGLARLHLCAALIRGNTQYAELGFDSGVEFPPHNLTQGGVNHQIHFTEPFSGIVLHYEEVARSFLGRAQADRNVFMTVFPSWDNTARMQNRSLIVLDACPDNYERWLAESLRVTEEQFPGQERLVFINAWNEWAEGCHLEPDRTYGRGFLEATLRAKSGQSTRTDFVRLELAERPRSLREDALNLCRYHAATSVSSMRRLANRHPRIKNALRRILKAVRLWPSPV